MKATWNGKTLAESDETIVIENNHYFPPTSLKKEFFKTSEHQSTYPLKGLVSYYSIEVDGEQNQNAAWYCCNRIRFWSSSISIFRASWKTGSFRKD